MLSDKQEMAPTESEMKKLLIIQLLIQQQGTKYGVRR